MSGSLPSTTRVRWRRTHRIIRSIYPPIDLFEDIADPADWELIVSAEAKTNPRVRDQAGAIRLVPPERRVGGPGASWAMAPFTHVSPERPTRFTDGTFGAYYAGDRFEVALAETIHHHERFMRATAEPAADDADYRELVGSIDAELHDLRRDDRFGACLAPDDHGTSQALARRLRGAGSDGIVYPSVRCPKGEAIAAFWPDVVGVPTQGRHLRYRWTGARVDAYLIYGESDDWIAYP